MQHDSFGRMSSDLQQHWQAEVRRILDQIGAVQEPYAITVSGHEIIVLPGVFSPKYFTDSEWFAGEVAAIARNKRLLEIGTGTGIVALVAALRGASVVATDINRQAVKNAQLNFQRHEVSAVAVLGDMYAPIPTAERFDVIFWNHPFNRGTKPAKNALEMAAFDFEYQSLQRYIRNGHTYLNASGQLLLGTGAFAITQYFRTAAGHDCYAATAGAYSASNASGVL